MERALLDIVVSYCIFFFPFLTCALSTACSSKDKWKKKWEFSRAYSVWKMQKCMETKKRQQMAQIFMEMNRTHRSQFSVVCDNTDLMCIKWVLPSIHSSWSESSLDSRTHPANLHYVQKTYKSKSGSRKRELMENCGVHMKSLLLKVVFMEASCLHIWIAGHVKRVEGNQSCHKVVFTSTHCRVDTAPCSMK